MFGYDDFSGRSSAVSEIAVSRKIEKTKRAREACLKRIKDADE